MAHNYRYLNVPTYSNAHYSVGGQEACLTRYMDEDDMRNLPPMQVLKDVWDDEDGAFQKYGVAVIKVIPSKTSKPIIDARKMPTKALETSLSNLFGQFSGKCLIPAYSVQHVARTPLDNDLPDGVLEVFNTQFKGALTVMEFLQELHDRRQFSPLTGHQGDAMKTFWKTITDKQDLFNRQAPAYAVDITASPTKTSKWAWDLSNLGKDEPFTNLLLQSLHSGPGYQRFFPGLHSPLTYIGGAGSFFAFHEEDMNLLSLNVHLGGYPKVWYVLRPESVQDFKEAAKDAIKEGFRRRDSTHSKCSDPLRHKNFLFTPDWLAKWGIHHDVVEQVPNSIVMTHPQGGHQGVNTGPMVNEAINFALESWLPHAKRSSFCDCGWVENPVRPSILPFVAHWDTRETAVAYMEGRLEGNTLITDVSQGYMPGELSYRPQKRHITSMKPTFENSFMNDFKDSLPVDEDTFKFYDAHGREMGFDNSWNEPDDAAIQAKLFDMDEESVWARSCKTPFQFDLAVLTSRQQKDRFLAEKKRSSVFVPKPKTVAPNILTHPSICIINSTRR